MKNFLWKIIFALAVVVGAQTQLHAQGTAFTYQGRLNFNGSPAAGNFDFRFKLYADPLGNTQVGGSYLTNAIPATNGLFTTTIDFGPGIFTGGTNWLEIDVRTNGAASYTVLSPLQGVTPTPNAIFATTAGNVSGTVSATQIIGGIIGNAVLPASPNFSGTVTANSISGNGANVTNVNAGTLNGLSATNFWQLGGNDIAAGQFLGSTNNQPVELRVNNQRLLRMTYATNAFNGAAPNILGGHYGNYISNGVSGATISGGGSLTNSFTFQIGVGSYATFYANTPRLGTNIVSADFGTVLGGAGNTASGLFCSTAMGFFSTASGGVSTAMGRSTASGDFSTAMGFSTASGDLSTAMGDSTSSGYNSTAMGNATASGEFSLASGDNTVASGHYSTAMGIDTTASGDYSTAMGNNSHATHQGAYVWADSQFSTFASTANDQFLIRAQGGVGINTNNPGNADLLVNGTIVSPLWKATTVINSSGSLTKTASLTTSGGTLVITASGSGYSAAGNASIGMDIKLDGVLVDSCLIYANAATTHLAFVPKTIVKTGVVVGAHSFTLVARAGTTTDGSDNFCVTVQEVPF